MKLKAKIANATVNGKLPKPKLSRRWEVDERDGGTAGIVALARRRNAKARRRKTVPYKLLPESLSVLSFRLHTFDASVGSQVLRALFLYF